MAAAAEVEGERGAQSWGEEARAQLRLSLPVAVIQVGMMTMGMVDAAFLGRVSAREFAAVTLGNNWSFGVTIFGMGVLVGLDPIISQAWGARDHLAIGRAMQRGMLLSLLLSIPIALLILPAEAVLRFLEQPAEVIPIATDYAIVSIAGVPAFLLFVAMRQGLQAMHVLRPLVIVIIATNLLNALLDWVLIYGNLGCPPLGAVGSSWATVISRWAMALLLPLLAWPILRRYLGELRPAAFRWRGLGQILGIGWPIGLQFVFEMGAFSVIGFLVGRLGTETIAGHQVALTLASFSFMLPLSISMAAAVRVGNEVGRGEPVRARRAAAASLVFGAGIMLVFAVLFLLFPDPLTRLFTDQEEVLAVATALLPLAACFQIFDGTQVVATGVLRGVADTHVPMLIHLVGFWCVGVPFGWFLAFRRDAGAEGLWWGLVAGLSSVAIVQLLRVRVRLARTLERVVGDETLSA